MSAKHAGSDEKNKPCRNGLFAGFGARIARSLFFWGLAAVLASSAYTGIVRIRGSRARVAESEAVPASGGRISDGARGKDAPEADVSGKDAPKEGVSKTDMSGEDAPKEGAPKTDVSGEDAPEADVSGKDAPKEGVSKTDMSGKENVSETGTPETRQDSDEQKRVALTFDDGPHPFYTEELLDGLKERGVKATFFVIGKNIPGNEDVIRRMAKEGHLIGNHTYDHARISLMGREEACEQIEKTSRLVRELTGKDTEFVRPPFGEWKKDLECSFVMIPVLWDVDPKDWTTKNVSDIVRRVLEDVQDGDIILLHDYYRSSVQAALEIVDTLQEQGYVFVTVDELILE